MENALYRVEISNRGGVVKSWQLKKYKDDAKPQRVLDVVHPEAAAAQINCNQARLVCGRLPNSPLPG